MEILSPAGNYESLTAAVRSGADAVYLGLKDFSARRNAENFDINQLAEAIKYCHIRGVKVYVTVNTMIKESELPSSIQAVISAYNCGADAFIVSDLGLISVLHAELPEIPLHASTQMTVHSPAAIKSLKKLGIKRVVLAREMSREEIKSFCEAAKKEDIEVEVFVHGALCMCVSGQCLLSSVLGGRSGNRGLCAGPCRLQFSAAGSGRYDLSLKDLSLTEYLKELENTGVQSAKIEGRMKRPEYVAAATSACRAAIDGKRDKELENALKGVFSRSGFTDGYYTSRLGADMFGTRTKEDVLSAYDTFSFIHTLYKAERQSVAVKFTAEIKSGENMRLTVTDDYGLCFTVSGDIPQTANTKSTDESFIKTQLSKLGGTPYFAKEITVKADSGIYVNAAAVNSLRRKALEVLSAERSKNTRNINFNYSHSVSPSQPGRQKVYARFASPRQIPDDTAGIDGVILPFEFNFTDLPKGILKIAELPRYITDEGRTEKRLTALKKQGVHHAYCGNLSAIEIARKSGLHIIAANGLNAANSESIRTLNLLGAKEVVLSAEVNISSARRLGAGTGIFAYGRLPLMLTRNCPVKNTETCKDCGGKSALRDRKGVLFPVTCREGYSEVLNSSPIYLADKRADLDRFDFLLLYFTDEDRMKVRDIITRYAEGKGSNFDFTRGLYYKNLL